MPDTVNHNPVTAAMFAGSVVALIVPIAKSQWHLDLSGQEANLTVVVSAVVGFVVPYLERKFNL